MKNSKNTAETVVGGIVLLLCAIFIGIIYRSSTNTVSSDNGMILSASFDRADGISIGSSVTISGIKVGEVIEEILDKNSYSAVVKFSIGKEINLPADTSAEIVSNGLFGEKYIALIPGADSEYLKNGDVIEYTQSAINIENMISRLIFKMEGNNKIENNMEKIDDVVSDEAL